MDTVLPVQRQLDAYNARDLQTFVAQYAEDVKVFRLPSADPVLVGRQALAEHYATKRFNLPSLHAELVARITFGNKVIDHEFVTGLGPEPVNVAAIYEVVDGLIRAVWFVAAE